MSSFRERSRVPIEGNEIMGHRNLEEDRVKEERSRKLRRERGPKMEIPTKATVFLKDQV